MTEKDIANLAESLMEEILEVKRTKEERKDHYAVVLDRLLSLPSKLQLILVSAKFIEFIKPHDPYKTKEFEEFMLEVLLNHKDVSDGVLQKNVAKLANAHKTRVTVVEHEDAPGPGPRKTPPVPIVVGGQTRRAITRKGK